MLWEDTPEINTPPVCIENKQNKEWCSIGKGEEVLVKVEIKKEEEDNNITSTKWAKNEIVNGDFVFYKDKWSRVVSVEDAILGLDVNGEEIKAEVKNCLKSIPIEILICTDITVSVNFVEVEGLNTLEKIGKKILKKASSHLRMTNWYFRDKAQAITETVYSLELKPNDKLVCGLLSYEIKKFKRFKELGSGNWHMSNSSYDSIIFVPTKCVVIFGFGMYCVKDGPKTYTIEYELFLNEKSIQKTRVNITDENAEDKIFKVYFRQDKSSIQVAPNTKIGICVRYAEFDNSSHLYTGTSGGSNPVVEGNEEDLFRIETHHNSSNGTGTSSGQIPEIYYSKEE